MTTPGLRPGHRRGTFDFCGAEPISLRFPSLGAGVGPGSAPGGQSTAAKLIVTETNLGVTTVTNTRL